MMTQKGNTNPYANIYRDYELAALRECALEIYRSHSVEIDRLQAESLQLQIKATSPLFDHEKVAAAKIKLDEEFSRTLNEALRSEGIILQEGIFAFFKGIFRAFLALFGIGVEEKEKEVAAKYVSSVDKKLAAQTPKGQEAPTWKKLKPKEIKRDFGIVANFGQAMADDAIDKVAPAMDKFVSLNIPPVPPAGGAAANEGLIIEQAAQDPYADNKEDLKQLAAAAGQIRGAITTLAPYNSQFEALSSKLKASPANAPIDLVQQLVVGTKALLPITTKEDLANGIIAKGVEYITDAGANTAAIDDAGVAISTTLGGDAGKAAGAANQVDEQDMIAATETATAQLEQGVDEAQGGIIDKMKAALQNWLKASGITDPCAYVEENRDELEGELKALEDGMAKVKAGGMDLNNKLKTIGTMFGAFGAASFPAAAMAATETVAATTAFVTTNPAAVASAGYSAITGGGTAALGGLVQHATILGLQATSWLALGKVLLVLGAIILVYRYLLKEGYLCTIAELVSGVAKPLQMIVGPAARKILDGILGSIKGWANKIWDKLRGKKNEARIMIAHEILCEEFGIPLRRPSLAITMAGDYGNIINTAALEWVDTHTALEDCLAHARGMYSR